MTKTGEAVVAELFEWKDAACRLDIMEAQAARALEGGWKLARIVVRQNPDVTLESLGMVRASSIIRPVSGVIEGMDDEERGFARLGGGPHDRASADRVGGRP